LPPACFFCSAVPAPLHCSPTPGKTSESGGGVWLNFVRRFYTHVIAMCCTTAPYFGWNSV
jgi:hypothetical protein